MRVCVHMRKSENAEKHIEIVTFTDIYTDINIETDTGIDTNAINIQILICDMCVFGYFGDAHDLPRCPSHVRAVASTVSTSDKC